MYYAFWVLSMLFHITLEVVRSEVCVSLRCDSFSIGIFLLRLIVNNNSCINDYPISWGMFDCLLVHESHKHSPLGGAKTLGETSQFFTHCS